MTALTLIPSATRKRRNLTVWFCISAVVVTCLVVSMTSFVALRQMRAQWMGVSLEEVARVINQTVLVEMDGEIGKSDSPQLANYWQSIANLNGVQQGAFFDLSMGLVWASGPQMQLTAQERSKFPQVLGAPQLSRIMDTHVSKLNGQQGFFGDSSKPVAGLIPIRGKLGKALGMLKLVSNYEYVLRAVEQTVMHLLWYLLVGNLLLFSALFYNLRRGFRTIRGQEEELNQQISRLSNLLSINKSMQTNMKIASRRAVELNEQFLRRVGSDLHDGPAQLIGYSVMRLDRVSEDERSKDLSEEFHVVKEALDGALKEIRDISSGLVLPELEELTLQQTLQKVVSRNSVNSNTKVIEYYKDLPDQIPLPVKICVYRFVQEGLNNANRHGKAEKCRVTAYAKDDVLHLSLKDNGIGFRKSKLSTDGGHLGLMGLKDRIESLGGTFSINSKLGVGTAIKASIAVADEIWPHSD